MEIMYHQYYYFLSGFKKSHDVPNPKFDIVYTYAVSFSLVKCRASISDLEKMLNPLGKVIVVKSLDDRITVYLHTDCPGLVVGQAVDWGQIEDIKIQNLAIPHDLKNVDKTIMDIAILAVADDEKTAQSLEQLGAIAVITQDKVSGPAVGDLINLIHGDIAKNYIILSNNKSSSLVMAQVKRLLKNNIEILYTNNVEEQIKALKAFDVNETLKVNLQNMHEAI